MRRLRQLKKLFDCIVSPRSKDRDQARKELILNIQLVSGIVLTFVLSISSTITYLIAINTHKIYVTLPPYIVYVGCIVLFLAYLFSKFVSARIVIYLLITFYFLGATYTVYQWGANTPQAMLMYALVIIMSGIMVGSKFSFFVTFLTASTLYVITSLQISRVLAISTEWRSEDPHLGDVSAYSITLFVIAVVSWLSNREMERALSRARSSERALKRERDSLEATVEKRTRELRAAQMERAAQLYRFAEFGKISSGIFHDIATPLSLVTLSLDQLREKSNMSATHKLVGYKSHLTTAMIGVSRLENYIKSARRQLRNQEIQEYFFPTDEVLSIVKLLDHRAKKAGVRVLIDGDTKSKLYGSPIKFSQVIMNITLNAIDAYDGVKTKKPKVVTITIDSNHKHMDISINDQGIGISATMLSKIFDPFFTTKETNKGIGIGLSLCKEIIEKNFGGGITAESTKQVGTTFTITLPLGSKTS